MDALECITTRRSIRRFKPDPLPKEVVTEVIDIAKWSPSYKNSQPWEAVICSGAKKEALSAMLLELLAKDARPSPDVPAPQSWPPREATRIQEHVQHRRASIGVDLGDPDHIKKAKKDNYQFYGAPHVIYLFQDADLSPWSLFDLGLFAQNIMLAAHAKGLGTVPQAFATDYATEIKRFLDIPDTKRLILGMPIGYPDTGSPEYQYRPHRAETETVVHWIE
ncbi:MAG: nitroreductase [Deltaproteobacteria bacterium]